MAIEKVVLVDEDDLEKGTMEKMEAHQKGVLHRAFSVFVFNEAGEMMLQQRALHKYHSPGLWTNACCSHPRQGESVSQAAHRRLGEEMGFDCDLKKTFHFIYRAQVGDLIEHELDHVLTGTFAGLPKPNPEEVADWKWISISDLKDLLAKKPDDFTVWFKICLAQVLELMSKSDKI